MLGCGGGEGRFRGGGKVCWGEGGSVGGGMGKCGEVCWGVGEVREVCGEVLGKLWVSGLGCGES